jgi:hypothetical protein
MIVLRWISAPSARSLNRAFHEAGYDLPSVRSLVVARVLGLVIRSPRLDARRQRFPALPRKLGAGFPVCPSVDPNHSRVQSEKILIQSGQIAGIAVLRLS